MFLAPFASKFVAKNFRKSPNLGTLFTHDNILKLLNNLIHRSQVSVFAKVNFSVLGGSPGLVVMGGGSRSKGRGFESRHRILDGHDIFSH